MWHLTVLLWIACNEFGLRSVLLALELIASAPPPVPLCPPLSPGRYVFQGVHMLLQMTCSSQGDVAPWGVNEKRTNRIVFIGRNLDREGLTKSFEECLVQQAQPMGASPPSAGRGVTVQA